MRINSSEYRLGYRKDIEGLRATAILLVIGAHAGVPWLQGGFVGVDVFFVLSGFLITGLLTDEIFSTGQLQLTNFYIRRLRRLLPALLAMLSGSAFLAAH
jgi:peptidoglycan/LPS O-acetylase OafA/YrhL